jgi:hypothetical protein
MSSSHQREYASFSRAELQFLSDARSSSVKAVGRFPLSDHNFYSWADIAQLFFEEFNTFDPRENDAAILKRHTPKTLGRDSRSLARESLSALLHTLKR